MRDYGDFGYSKMINREEDAAWEACFNAACKEGHTQEEAENCDDGDVGCGACPWKKDA